MHSIVLLILIVLIEVWFVIDIKIVRIMSMKLIVNTVNSSTRIIPLFVHRLLDNQRAPISFRSKIILISVLLTIISFDISSILICYFCCGISNRNFKERKSTSKFSFVQKYIQTIILFRSWNDGRRWCCGNSTLTINTFKTFESIQLNVFFSIISSFETFLLFDIRLLVFFSTLVIFLSSIIQKLDMYFSTVQIT